MQRSNKKRTLGLVLIVAAAAAVFIGISASMTHSAAVPTVPVKHVVASNGVVASLTGSTIFSQSSKGGPCHRCIVAHPFEARLTGA